MDAIGLETVSFEANPSRVVMVSGRAGLLAELEAHVEGYLQVLPRQFPGWRILVLPSELSDESINASIERVKEEGRTILIDHSASLIAFHIPDVIEQVRYATFLVADICRWEAASTETSYLHAGAVETPTGGLLLVGPSRCGKTTLALGILKVTEGQFVGDNNVSITRNPECMAVGWPTPVALRRSASSSINLLLPGFQKLCASTPPALPSHRDVIDLFPDHLRELGIRTKRTTRIRALVFPKLSNDKEEAAVATRVAPEVAEIELLRAWDIIPERKPGVDASVILNQNGDWRTAAFHTFTVDIFRSRIPSLEIATPAWLAHTAPSYELRFGENRVVDAARTIIKSLN